MIGRKAESTLAMIFIGIGSNLPGPGLASPLDTCRAAVESLADDGIRAVRRSRWYRSAPVPPSDQPWFVNGVIEAETDAGPEALMATLLAVEGRFGRRRGSVDAARVLDLDILAMGARVSAPGDAVSLPHPRMHTRAFVLLPLAELAPDWRHPVSGLGLDALIDALPEDQTAEPLAES